MSKTGWRMELNDIQPLLADFTLLAPNGNSFLLEYKANQFSETADEVTFRLHYGDPEHNPFMPLRLWDFVLWHDAMASVAYYFPRSLVPDCLSLARAPAVTISRDKVARWRLVVDSAAEWIAHMINEIILPFAGRLRLETDLLTAWLRSRTSEGERLQGDAADEAMDEEVPLDDPDLGDGHDTLRTYGARGYGLHGMMCALQDHCVSE